MKKTIKDMLFGFILTMIIASIAVGLGLYSGRKEKELIREKEKLEKTVEKLVDELEKAVEKTSKEQSSKQWKTVKMNVSAYCPCTKCCETWANIPVSSGKRKTASGHTIHVGDKFVAAPRNYPFGTEMVIEGYAGGKVVKVEDVGGAIKDNKLDLYFDTHDDALKFGRKDVNVRVKIKG